MDDSVSTILYIVISLVILLASTLGRKKKPVQQAKKPMSRPSPMEQLAREFSMTEFLGEEADKYTGMDIPVQEERTAWNKPEHKPFLQEDYTGAEEGSRAAELSALTFLGEEPAAKSGDSRIFQGEGSDLASQSPLFFQGEAVEAIQEEGKRIIDIMDEDYMKMTEITDHKYDEEEQAVSGSLSGFDASKAVIYSEILRRKYE